MIDEPDQAFLIEIDLGHLGAPNDLSPTLAINWVGYVHGEVTRADGEARLLASYHKLGPKLGRDVLGGYALVLVDHARRQVLLTQDSLGLRTLYHAQVGDMLFVASDLPRLMRRLPRRTLNCRYFAHFIANAAHPPDCTPFAEIGRLNGGTSLLFEHGRRTVSRAWTPPDLPVVNWAPAAAASRLCELLDEAVSGTCPTGAGRIMCELSGGLDSSTVLAIAQNHCPDITALTIASASGRSDANELICAQLMVEHTGVAWRQIDLDATPRYHTAARSVLGEPGEEAQIGIREAYYAAMRATDARVVLTGGGGDIIFGYGGLPPLHLGDGLASFRPLASVRAAQRWAEAAGSGRPWTHFLLRYGMAPALMHWRRRSLVAQQDNDRRPKWLSRRFLARHGVNSWPPAQTSPRMRTPGRQYLWESIYSAAHEEAISPFRMSLPAETRHPLMYRPLAAFLFSLDPTFRAEGADDRRLQRAAMAERLPFAVRSRKDKGGAQRAREHDFAHAEQWMRQMIDQSRLVALGWVEPDEWARQIGRARFGLFDGRAQFDAAMATEAWLRANEKE